MALNIRDLTRLAEFEMDTSSFGRVRIGNLKVSDVGAAENAHAKQQALAEEVARILFSRLARPLGQDEDESSTNGEAATHFDGSKLNADEVEEFAKQLAKHNSYFAKTADGDELTKQADESYSAFLLKLVLQYHITERERWEKLMRPVTSPVFGDATRAAWAESVLASDRLGASLKILQSKEELPSRLEVPLLPRMEHPMRGTNERLDALVDRLEDYRPALVDTAAAIVALERTVREMQADFASNSAEADRRMLRAEIVATVSLIFTAVGLATSTYFSNKQINDDSIVRELRAIRVEQQADRKSLADVMEKLAKTRVLAESPAPRPSTDNKRSSHTLADSPKQRDVEASQGPLTTKTQK